MSEENTSGPKRSLTSLWLLIALCTAPVAASYVAYYFWRPSQRVNYGELLAPQPLPADRLTLADGTPFDWSQLRGKWLLVTADSARCEEYCQRKLLYLRQIRLAQGKETERIERVWLITDGGDADPALLAQHGGLWLVRAENSTLLKSFPAARMLSDHIYIVDPLGNLMMRYPRDADPRKIVKDVARLLRHSQWR